MTEYDIATMVKERFATIKFQGLIATTNPQLRVESRGLDLWAVLTLFVPSVNGGERVGVAFYQCLPVRLDAEYLDHLLEQMLREAWEHELREGTALRSGGWLIGDPHPR